MPPKRKLAGAATCTTTPSFTTNEEGIPNKNIMKSPTLSGPIGAIINPGTSSVSKRWCVGKLLGRGACGSVHEVEPVATPTDTKGSSSKRSQSWVIKLAAVPHKEESVGSNGRPSKKRKKTADERNADTIHLERSLFCNTLLNLQGVYVPSIPQYGQSYAPPPFGEFLLPCPDSSSSPIIAYTYLVMERMASSLPDWRPCISSGIVKFGPIAQQMLECLRQLHSLNLVYVDVKLESFMFTQSVPNSTAAKRKNDANLAPNSLRLIDFGLVESFYDTMTNKHRQDCSGATTSTKTLAAIVGTPLYASIHVMEGHSPSRRDDVEALGYVFMDILTQEGLPWKHATSNQDILLSKKQLLQQKSLSSTSLNKHNADLLRQYMDTVHRLSYTEKPNYDSLSDILAKLQGNNEKDITVPSGSKSYKASTVRTRGNATSTRSTPSDTDTAAASASTMSRMGDKNSQSIKVASRKGKKDKPVVNLHTQHQEVTIDSSHNGVYDADDYNNTNDPVSMDWETTEQDDTNSYPKPMKEHHILDTKKTTQKVINNHPQEFDSLKLQFMEGPAKGECIEVHSTLTIGRDQDSQNATTSKKKHNHHFTVKDPNIALQQLKITFCQTKFKSYSIRVANVDKDTSSKGNTNCYVKGKLLAQGDSVQCFAGDKIQFGSSTLVVIKG